MNSLLSYLLCLCLLIPVISQAQVERKQKKLDKRQVEKKVEVGEMFDNINQANSLLLDQPEAALSPVEDALKSAYTLKDPRGEAYSQNTLGAINIQLARYDVAITHLQQAEAIFIRLKETTGLYSVYKNLGIAHEALGNRSEAVDYYEQFLAMAREKPGAQADMSFALNRLGTLLAQDGQKEPSIAYLEEALTLAKDLEDTTLQVRIYNDIGTTCQAAGETEEAITAFQNANQLTQGLMSSLQLSKPNSRAEAQPKGSDLLPPTPQQKEAPYEPRLNRQIGELYLQQNQTITAIPYLQKSIDLAGELGELQEQTVAYQQLGEAYEQLGDLPLALQNYRSAATVAEAAREEEVRGLNESQKMEIELRARDQRIALMKKDQELQDAQIAQLEQARIAQAAQLQQQRLMVYGLLGLLGLALVAGLLVMRAYRARQRSNQQLALKSLRSQLNPHFLFNSLNSINSFISQQDERAANKYLADFARLMRSVLEHSQEDWVPLSTELEMLQLYLRLEHVRFDDQFDYEWYIDPAIDKDQVEVPPLLIQPYVENAIWHGLRYKEGKGQLAIRLTQEDDQLRVEISDNGIGRSRSHTLKTKNQRSQQSTGLRNTQQRLHLLKSLYGRNLHVHLSDLDPDADDPGTLVQISIPSTGGMEQ